MDHLEYSVVIIDFFARPASVSPSIKSISNELDIAVHEFASKRWSLWRHEQLAVTSSAERKPSEWDTGSMCEDRVFFSSIMDFPCRVRNETVYILSWQSVYAFIRVLFGVYFPRSLVAAQLGK